MDVWLFAGALLAAGCVVLVALPFLRRPGLPATEDRLEETDSVRLELADERNRALAALKELEFDHRTGKVSDEDYRSLVGPLRRRAADTLRALDGREEASTSAPVYGGTVKEAAKGHKSDARSAAALGDREGQDDEG